MIKIEMKPTQYQIEIPDYGVFDVSPLGAGAEAEIRCLFRELDEAMESLSERLASVADAEQEPIEDDNTSANNFIVKQAISYMEQHYKEKLQLTDVAEKVYVSHWHLSKLLNSTGKSFSDVLNEIRIENAKELMEDSSLHIADISDRVGFADTAHFSRVFKKYTGMSANEYRNKFLR